MEFSTHWMKDSTSETLVVKGCHGNLDHSVCESFKERISHEVRGRTRRVVIDFSRVEFMDSTGLAGLICVLKRLGPSGEIVLCGLRRSVSNFLWLTHMDRVFTFAATYEDAVVGLVPLQRVSI